MKLNLMNKFVLSGSLFLCLIGIFYTYQYFEIDRIPNDITKTDHLYFLALSGQGTSSFAQHLVAYGMERAAERQNNLDFNDVPRR